MLIGGIGEPSNQHDTHPINMIAELYMNQEAVVRIEDDVSDPGIIGRGVRQGCPISPLLFSIYAEAMMAEALEEVKVKRLRKV